MKPFQFKKKIENIWIEATPKVPCNFYSKRYYVKLHSAEVNIAKSNKSSFFSECDHVNDGYVVSRCIVLP